MRMRNINKIYKYLKYDKGITASILAKQVNLTPCEIGQLCKGDNRIKIKKKGDLNIYYLK